MVTQRKSTDERRVEIADAALRLIGSRGLAALTIATLAKELGISGGALYRHFDSLEAILTAVAARAADLIDASTPPDDLAASAWLRAFADKRTAAVGGHAGLSRLLLSDQLTLGLPPPAVALVAGAVIRTRASILRKLVEGQSAGTLRADVPAAQLVPIVMGTVQIIALQRAGSVLPRAPGDAMTALDALLVLLAPPSATRPASNLFPTTTRRTSTRRK
jgi:AcrR family transcriptional regulator